MYYSRGFMPFLEPTLNKMVLAQMAHLTPKPDVLNYDNNEIHAPDNDIVNRFPSKKEFDECLWYYWHAIHPLIPILDQTEIQDNYSIFWEQLERQDSIFDINFALLLLAMLFATKSANGFNEMDKEKSLTMEREKKQIYDLYETIKTKCGLNLEPTFDFLKASVIIFYTGTFYYVGLFSATSMLSRLAEFMGFHRDPLMHTGRPETLSPKELDRRRYVWNFIRYLDTSTSVQSGLSPHMILINASTEFPSKYDYNAETGEFDGPLSPFRLFNIAMFKSSLVLETVIHCLNFDFTSEEDYRTKTNNVTATVMALYRDVGGIIGEILSCRGCPNELISFLVAHASGSVHRVFLLHLSGEGRTRLYHNKVISRPVDLGVKLPKLDLQNVTPEFFKKTLEVDSEYPILIIRILILFVYETKDRVNTPDNLQQYTWFSKNTNPMQYIFFLIRDIYAYPNRHVTIDSLPSEILNFYIPPVLLNYREDLRRFVIDTAFSYLFQFNYLWPDRLLNIMDFLAKLKDFVYGETESKKDFAKESLFTATEAKSVNVQHNNNATSTIHNTSSPDDTRNTVTPNFTATTTSSSTWLPPLLPPMVFSTSPYPTYPPVTGGSTTIITNTLTTIPIPLYIIRFKVDTNSNIRPKYCLLSTGDN